MHETAEPRPAAPVACAWCGAGFDVRSQRLPGRIRCASCGASTTDPWPSSADLDAAYRSYRPETGRFSGPGDRLLSRLRAGQAARIDAIAPPGPILDVGAGDGTLLRALRRRGRECVGVEREPGEGVLGADPRELGGTWSAVVFWHSLEHLPEPGAVFDHAVGSLVPGGVIVVAAPNEASLQARAFGGRWFALDPPRHLVHLPVRALAGRARSLGLTVERVSHLRGGQAAFGWLHGLVGSLPGRPDLYDAIRRPEARSAPLSGPKRAATLLAGVVLFGPALSLSLFEAAIRRGGSLYVEARRS